MDQIEEIQDEPLTAEDSFDIDSIIERATAEAEGRSEEDLDEDPDGPDQGELSEDVEEEGETEDSEDEEDPEPEGHDEEADEGEDDSEDEEEPESQASTGPLEQQLATLKAEVEQQRMERQALLWAMQQQAQPQTQAPTASQQDKSDFETALYLAQFGRTEQDSKTWESLPARVRKDATEFAEHRARMETRYTINPELRFQNEIAPFVERMVQERLAPLVQEYQARRANEIVAPLKEKLKDPADKERVRVLLEGIPGSRSADWRDQEAALKLAVEKLELEKKLADLEKRSQGVRAKEAQQEANKRARKRGTRGGRRGSTNKTPPPSMKPGEDMEDYYTRLLKNADKYDFSAESLE